MIRNSLTNRSNPDGIAIIDGGVHYTYRQISNKGAAFVQRLAQKKGLHVAIFLPNGANYLAALYGIISAGMTAFPINNHLTQHEITSLLAQADVAAVVTSTVYRSLWDEIITTTSLLVVYAEEVPQASAAEPCICENVSPDEPMILLATSGTTGSAKIVQLSERNVEASTLAYISHMDYEKFSDIEIRITAGTPFFSSYGLLILTAYVINSFPIVVLEEPFSLDVLFKAAQTHRITHYEGGVSAGLLLEQTIGRSIPYDISSLRYFGLAGSMLPASTLLRLTEAYPGIEFWPGYGMTEAGPLIAKPYKEVNLAKPNSVGLVIDCETVMFDVDGQLTDAPNAVGELVVKGDNVMLGYYGNEEATRETIKDGFLYTGDIGYIDEDGYIYICGRKKNVIIVRGFNVHAEDVEACIMGSGLVSSCVVYGEADAGGNEKVCVDIVPISPATGADEVRAYCKIHLTTYKQPKIIRVVEEIMKTATGKIGRK